MSVSRLTRGSRKVGCKRVNKRMRNEMKEIDFEYTTAGFEMATSKSKRQKAHTEHTQQQKRIQQRQTHTKNATLVFHIMSQSNKARDPTLHEIGRNRPPPLTPPFSYFPFFFSHSVRVVPLHSPETLIVHMHGT